MSEFVERRKTDESKAGKDRQGLKFTSDINLGAVMQAGVVLCGLIAWAVTSANRSEQAGRDLTTMQQSVSAQITDLRGAVTTGLQDVRQQISTLPDQRAKLENDERRLAEAEGRLNNADQRMGVLERATIEMRSDLNQLMRAANMPLTPQGRPRP